MEEVEITIIGAGIVGLAIAAELADDNRSIIVLERNDSYGRETSSRNSEVIHSGIYYPEGSLKAKLCLEGAEQLYALCKEYSIPHKRIGKLIVATEESELNPLVAFYEKGRLNKVNDLKMLNKHDMQKIEPNIHAFAALYSPNTGIVDSHALMKYYYNSANDKGTIFAYNSNVSGIAKENNGYRIVITQDNYQFTSKVVINCAGLSSDIIAQMASIDIKKNGYNLNLCKGSYFSYAKPSPVNMLIYPLPHEELVGLGVHATLDMANRLRFGPDAEYVTHIDYKVDPRKRDAFYQGVSRIIPSLLKESFIPDMVGIRPKLQGPGEKTRDFVIAEESKLGLPGLINLIGIESPGLTASPAIAKMVRGMVSEILL